MFNSGTSRFLHAPSVAFSAAFILTGLAASSLAAPLERATVSKLENKVNFGEERKGRTTTRPAAVADVLRDNSFLLTESDSRAELKYDDGSVVRIGQNAVFSFDAETRTLSLEKGSLLFSIPHGAGGKIKTPSLTAAITGTVGKVSPTTIAILRGEVRLIPSGQIVKAGEFARMNPDGSITVAPFDKSTELEGSLVYFNGLMPRLGEPGLGLADFPPIDLSWADLLDRTQNQPGAQRLFNPAPRIVRKKKEKEEVIFVATPRPATPAPVVVKPPPPNP